MAINEQTSARIASIAARGLRDLSLVTDDEIREVFASALTQARDRHQSASAMRLYTAAIGRSPRARTIAEGEPSAGAPGAHSVYSNALTKGRRY